MHASLQQYREKLKGVETIRAELALEIIDAAEAEIERVQAAAHRWERWAAGIGYGSLQIRPQVTFAKPFPGPEQALPAEPGVYVARAIGTDKYKIGWSSNVRDRIRTLRSTCPVELRVELLVLGVGPADEMVLHELFASSRAHGEWFTESADLLGFIRKHTT